MKSTIFWDLTPCGLVEFYRREKLAASVFRVKEYDKQPVQKQAVSRKPCSDIDLLKVKGELVRARRVINATCLSSSRIFSLLQIKPFSGPAQVTVLHVPIGSFWTPFRICT
jgi:hypothetical protein